MKYHLSKIHATLSMVVICLALTLIGCGGGSGSGGDSGGESGGDTSTTDSGSSEMPGSPTTPVTGDGTGDWKIIGMRKDINNDGVIDVELNDLFDDRGNCIRKERDGGITSYGYDGANNKIYESYEDSDGLVYDSYYTYDSGGNLISKVTTYASSGATYQWVLSYHDERVATQTRAIKEAGVYRVLETIAFNYTPDNVLNQFEVTDLTSSVTSSTVLSYNSAGYIRKGERDDGNDSTVDYTIEATYDVQMNRLEENAFSDTSTLYGIIYGYDSTNNRLSEEIDSDGDGTADRRTTWSYGSTDNTLTFNLLSVYSMDSHDFLSDMLNPALIDTYEYERFKTYRFPSETRYDYNGDDTVDDITITHFDANGFPEYLSIDRAADGTIDEKHYYVWGKVSAP